MKTKLALLALLTCIAVYAASNIRWTWHDSPVVHDGSRIELGLRDGVCRTAPSEQGWQTGVTLSDAENLR